jgi:hypothetical protein
LGEERIAFRVGRSAAPWDCWTRVLRRSAGWRRMEDVRPEQRPAAKWKDVFEAVKECERGEVDVLRRWMTYL